MFNPQFEHQSPGHINISKDDNVDESTAFVLYEKGQEQPPTSSLLLAQPLDDSLFTVRPDPIAQPNSVDDTDITTSGGGAGIPPAPTTGGLSAGPNGSSITVVINLDPQDFTSAKEKLLINAIADIANVSMGSIHVMGIELGSVLVHLNLPIEVSDQQLHSWLEALKTKLEPQGLPLEDIFTYRETSNAKYTILFLAADPRNVPRIRILEELRSIQETIRLSRRRDNVKMIECPSVRISDLTFSMVNYRPNIVYFSGHGPQDGLCFESGAGDVHIPSIESIADLFCEFSDHTTCILLPVCHSTEQAKAIAECIDYVIGIESDVEDKFAIDFSTGFYQALAAGESIQRAYRLGLIQMQLEGYKGGKPVLLGRKAQTTRDQQKSIDIDSIAKRVKSVRLPENVSSLKETA